MNNGNSPHVDWQRLLDKPRIYVDLNGGGKVGDQYIALLNSSATAADLQKHRVSLQEGLALNFWTDDGDDGANPDPLLFRGTAHFHPDLNQWVALIDWDGFQRASQFRQGQKAKEAVA